MHRVIVILVFVFSQLQAQEKLDGSAASPFAWLLFKVARDSSLLVNEKKSISKGVILTAASNGGVLQVAKAHASPSHSSDTSAELDAGPTGCLLELAEPKFLQLRARMAAAADEREMIRWLASVVRDNCFSVSQLQRLCAIFLHDDTRYQFFEMVYRRVTDPQSLPALAPFLTDPAYQKRFLSLLER